MEPLKPLEPLPSLWQEKRKKRLLSWATAAVMLCAIGVGILHGVGGKIINAVWELLRTG